MRIKPGSLCPESIRIELPAIIEGFDSQGRLLYAGRNTIKSFNIGDASGERTAVAKRFGVPNIFQRIGKIGKPTKGEAAFINGERLLSLGFDTPAPYAYVENSRTEFYYVTAEDCGKPLLEMTPTDANADALAEFFAALHKKGVLHNDLNNTNIRFTFDDAGKPRFSLIDINRMQFLDDAPTFRECICNIVKWDGNTPFFKKVLKSYLEKRGLDDEQTFINALRLKDRHDNRYTKKKARLKKLKTILGHNK